jgi:hypothetical protein
MEFMMLKKLNILLIILISLFSFYGCHDHLLDSDDDTIHGSGRIVSENRSVNNCSGIAIRSAGKVILTQDSEQSVRVSADDNIIDEVITREENGILIVGLRDKSYTDIHLNVYVSLKEIRNLTIEGAGDIECNDRIVADNLYAIINGAGNIKLSGNGNYLSCLINGAGNINSSDYIVKKCNAVVNGAGNSIVNVTDELNAVVAGIGSIIYYGNPPVVSTSITGIGNIVRR